MGKSCWKKPGFWISAAGLSLLCGTFVFWLFNTQHLNKAGTVAAFASALLFAAMCLRFVPVWMRFWSKTGPEPRLEPARRTGLWKFFFLCLGFCLLTHLAVYGLRLLMGDRPGPGEELNYWLNMDSGYYLTIARQGYTNTGVEIVFFPGYPLMVRLFRCLTGNELSAALLVSALSYSASGCLLLRLLAMDHGEDGARRAAKYLFLMPGAFFFVAPMSESLFFLLCLASVYCARRGKWLLAGALGGYAAFTRSLGVLLLAPLVLEAVHACVQETGPFSVRWKKWLPAFACLLLVPLGTVLYLLINYRLFGNPFQFMVFEREVWEQGFGFFWATAAYQTDIALYVLGTDYYHIALGQWLPNVTYCFISLLVMAVAAKRLRPSYSAWFIAYYFFAIGATYLLSAPRYLLAAAPLYPGLAQVTESKKLDRFLSLLCLCASVFYFWAFLNGWEVY